LSGVFNSIGPGSLFDRLLLQYFPLSSRYSILPLMRALRAVVLLTVCLALTASAQVTARFYLNQQTYSIGEPLLFTLEIKNSTPDSIYLFPKAPGKCSDAFTFR
jgi:hypothetical protein